MSVVLAVLACGTALIGASLIGGGGFSLGEGDEDDGRFLSTTGEITLAAALAAAFLAGRWSL